MRALAIRRATRSRRAAEATIGGCAIRLPLESKTTAASGTQPSVAPLLVEKVLPAKSYNVDSVHAPPEPGLSLNTEPHLFVPSKETTDPSVVPYRFPPESIARAATGFRVRTACETVKHGLAPAAPCITASRAGATRHRGQLKNCTIAMGAAVRHRTVKIAGRVHNQCRHRTAPVSSAIEGVKNGFSFGRGIYLDDGSRACAVRRARGAIQIACRIRDQPSRRVLAISAELYLKS